MRPNIHTLSPVISEKMSGLIWKIKLNENGLMAIECRISETKEVSFTIIDAVNSLVNFKEISYDEKWNISLAYLGSSNMLLTGYGSENSPERKGILSVSTKDGSLMWQKYNISLNDVNAGGIQVYDHRVQPRKYHWIDHITGEPLTNNTESISNANDIIFPQANEMFDIPSFLNPGKVTGEIQVLQYKDMTFLSFHEEMTDFLKQRLVVYQEDNILIDDILISDIQKLQPEAFFIQKNHLFYIRNKQEIVSYLV